MRQFHTPSSISDTTSTVAGSPSPTSPPPQSRRRRSSGLPAAGASDCALRHRSPSSPGVESKSGVESRSGANDLKAGIAEQKSANRETEKDMITDEEKDFAKPVSFSTKERQDDRTSATDNEEEISSTIPSPTYFFSRTPSPKLSPTLLPPTKVAVSSSSTSFPSSADVATSAAPLPHLPLLRHSSSGPLTALVG